jgi:hypothetical protein
LISCNCFSLLICTAFLSTSSFAQDVNKSSSAIPNYCKQLKTIAKTGKNGNFDRLADSSLESYPSAVDGLEVYQSQLALGTCLVSVDTSNPRIECGVKFKQNDPEAIVYYKTFVQQVSTCLSKDIKKSKIDMQFTKPGRTLKQAYSKFDLSNNLKIAVKLQDGNVCGDLNLLTCDDYYGVFLDAWVPQ